MKANLSNTDKGYDIKFSSENNDEQEILSIMFDALSSRGKISSRTKTTSLLANDTEITISIKK